MSINTNNEYIAQGLALNTMREAILPKNLINKGDIYMGKGSGQGIEILPAETDGKLLVVNLSSATGLSYSDSLNGEYINGPVSIEKLVGDEGSENKQLISASGYKAQWGTVPISFENYFVTGAKLKELLGSNDSSLFQFNENKYNNKFYFSPRMTTDYQTYNTEVTQNIKSEILKFDLSSDNHCLTVTTNYLSNDFYNFSMRRIVNTRNNQYEARLFFDKTFIINTVTNFPGDPSSLYCLVQLKVPNLEATSLINVLPNAYQHFSANDDYIMYNITDATSFQLINNAINNNLSCDLIVSICNHSTGDIIQNYNNTIKLGAVPLIYYIVVAAVPLGDDKYKIVSMANIEDGCIPGYRFTTHDGEIRLYTTDWQYGDCEWYLNDITLTDYQTYSYDQTIQDSRLTACIQHHDTFYLSIYGYVVNKLDASDFYQKSLTYKVGLL